VQFSTGSEKRLFSKRPLPCILKMTVVILKVYNAFFYYYVIYPFSLKPRCKVSNAFHGFELQRTTSFVRRMSRHIG